MNIDELRDTAEETREQETRYRHVVRVCVAAGCLSCHSDMLLENLQAQIKERGMEGETLAKGVGCLGPCSEGPVVVVEPGGVVYEGVKPEDAGSILDALGKPPVERLAADPGAPFFSRQKKIVLENSGVIDPERIEEYIAAGGFEALNKALTQMTPQEVIQEMITSGLRGRGGGGYPTGLKWSTVAKAGGEKKYVICNADEGDPGAFMDRSVLESDPLRVLEGMTIAAYAVGADHGYVYVRAEYPLAIKRLKKAIRQAEKAGLLGTHVCGTTFNFTVEVRLGAGAFVCGEETALIASIEGKRGAPRPRPPYPAERGLWGYSTLINNVETFANVPPILRNGGAWFAQIGTEKSKGTKVFALAGRVNRTGLIEVPMGITLREIVFEIGGGIPGGKKFKAVQTGGPSGGCIPSQFLDMPVDYDSLAQIGSIMGSGGMIVLDETSCMVDVAKYFMDFCVSESCGKCVPCRVGTNHIWTLLDRICRGEGTMDDLTKLEELADLLKGASLCGLGQTAPNPALSTLKYFREEYLAHIVERRCPAGVCKMQPVAEVAK